MSNRHTLEPAQVLARRASLKNMNGAKDRDQENKAPRRKQRGINGALQTAGFQPAFAPRSGELNPQRLKLYRKTNTGRQNQAHRIYPYLLRHLAIDRPNQVWAMDTTYIPMQKGFVYLSAVLLDWATRRIPVWRLSNTLTADPCIEALEEAIVK